jgi:hypothetical protein
MSTNKSGMRRLALVTVIISSIALALSACSSETYGKDSHPQTSKFVFDKFNGGEFLDTFTPGEPEEGITLEAMAQLSALGYDKTKQEKAIAWTKANYSELDSIGLKATYIFTAHSLGFADDATVRTAVEEVVAGIADDGTVRGNNFVYSWVIFALLSENNKELANTVALKLTTLSEVSGGYKYLTGDTTSESATDVTSFAIMALQASLGTGSEADEAAKEFAISKSKAFVTGTIVDGNHWNSYGDVDISGTAYAIMALTSVGSETSDAHDWLKSRINSADGGVIAPWTDPSSDTFSTAQSLLALSHLSFVDVLLHKVN